MAQQPPSPDAERTARALRDHGLDRLRPICRSTSMAVQGYTSLPLWGDLSVSAAPGQPVSAVVLICANCGFIRLHSTAVLGLDRRA